MRVFTIASLAIAVTLAMATVSAAADGSAAEKKAAPFAAKPISRHSHDGMAINYVGLGYVNPWFVDSYFDYLPHLIDGMAEMPEMAPADADHILGSSSMVKQVSYVPGRIEYTTVAPQGSEILRITFKPGMVWVVRQAVWMSIWIGKSD